MYLTHFQLNLKPFQVNADNRFFYLSEKHQEALCRLVYGIQDNRGVLVLTGDVGTGKTLLIHALVENLGPNVKTAVITDPSLKGLDFFKFMAHAFGIGIESRTKGEFLINFENYLDGLFKVDRQALLIIDEAQNLDSARLEEIRILSNYERGNNRLNIFFVGQDEFNSMLLDKRLRALKQRITTHYHIEPLSLEETGLYVRYRLKVAGCARPLFTPSALEKIFGLTNGYPRLINIICDHCLLTAFVGRVNQIDPDIVDKSVADLHPSQLSEKTISPIENKPGLTVLQPADIQPTAAPQTPPGVTSPTTKQVDLTEPPKSTNSSLPTFLRQPAYLLAGAVLILALVWFNFRDAPYFGPQVSNQSPEFHQKNQTKADRKPALSSMSNKQPGAPQMESGNRIGPTDSTTRIPTEQQLINTTAVPPDQAAPLLVVSPTDSSHDKSAAMQPSLADHPISMNTTTLERRAKEELEPQPSVSEPDQITVTNRKAGSAEIGSDASPLSTLPAARKTDGPPLLLEKKGKSDLAAAQPASPPPAETSAPVVASGEIEPDQATQSIPVDAPSPSASPPDAATAVLGEQPQERSVTSPPATVLNEPANGDPEFRDTENDPRAIIDYVIRKRSRQSGDQ